MKSILLLALLAGPAMGATAPVTKEVTCKEYAQVTREATGLIYMMNLPKIIEALKRAHPTVPEEHVRGILAFVLQPPITPGETSAAYIEKKCLELVAVEERGTRIELREIER
jgi:hypothetical protein